MFAVFSKLIDMVRYVNRQTCSSTCGQTEKQFCEPANLEEQAEYYEDIENNRYDQVSETPSSHAGSSWLVNSDDDHDSEHYDEARKSENSLNHPSFTRV